MDRDQYGVLRALGLCEGASHELIDEQGVRWRTRLVWRDDGGWCLCSEDGEKRWPVVFLWRTSALSRCAHVEGGAGDDWGEVHVVGVAAPGAYEVVEGLMNNPVMLLVDIRARAHSRYFPQWRKGWMVARWGSRYTHERALSGVGGRRRGRSVELARGEEERAIVEAAKLVRKGYSLLLLCWCRGGEQGCHCGTVRSRIVEQAAKDDRKGGK